MKTVLRRLILLGVTVVLTVVVYKVLCLRAVYLVALNELGVDNTNALLESLDGGEVVGNVAIAYLSVSKPESLPRLLEALRDQDARKRAGVARALGIMTVKQPAMVPILREQAVVPLTQATRDTDCRVRIQAAFALWHVNRRAQDVVPTLIQCWRERHRHCKYWAYVVLAEIGPEAHDALPALLEGMRSSDETIRVWATDAIEKIDLK
jgi:HEAT repeat protein